MIDEKETYAASFEKKGYKLPLLPKKKNKHLPALAIVCDRVVISDRAAALITLHLQGDIRVVSSQDTSEVADRNK